MEHLFQIESIIATYGYLGIFIIVFLESGIFFALPGDSLLFTAGILASLGTLDIFLLVPLIFISTLLGSIFGYFVGENLERYKSYWLLSQILKPKHIHKAHVFFEKHGKQAIIFSRFIPIVRTFTPIVAGVAKMKYPLFIKYSLIGATLWSSLMTTAGFFLGRAFPQIKEYMTLVIILVVFLSILPAVYEVWREKSQRGQQS